MDTHNLSSVKDPKLTGILSVLKGRSQQENQKTWESSRNRSEVTGKELNYLDQMASFDLPIITIEGETVIFTVVSAEAQSPPSTSINTYSCRLKIHCLFLDRY